MAVSHRFEEYDPDTPTTPNTTTTTTTAAYYADTSASSLSSGMQQRKPYGDSGQGTTTTSTAFGGATTAAAAPLHPTKTTRVTTTKARAGGAAPVAQTGTTWGRTRDVDRLTVLISLGIMVFCPILVVYFYVAIASFGGALTGPAVFLFQTKPPVWALPTTMDHPLTVPRGGGWSVIPWSERLYAVLPAMDWHVTGWLMGWIAFQAILYQWLPGPIGYGQRTPAGYLLAYHVNGLNAWVVTHALYLGLSLAFPLFSGSVIADHWGALLVAANLYGYALTLFSYAKAHWFPTHPEDRKFSGSIIYDLYMGIEFNPRIGAMFDFKLFHNGRPGIIAWTLITYSFAVQQYLRFGYVTNSMVLVNLLHATYVLDFFYNEDWYLRTIDISHDHFGFYLAWGDSVMLPFMYTLQGFYLATNPIQLPPALFWSFLGMGAVGYAIFRGVNHQKDLVRRTNGHCRIWGRAPVLIRPTYVTSDGVQHRSLLLASGYWGLSRHFNYLGDLLLAAAMCLACGFEHLTPYFYLVFMVILLVSRIYRDDARCRGKYGRYWDEYCRLVPYKLIPFIW